MSTPYPSTCPKCAKCRLYIQRRCKGLLDYQRRWCPEWITYGMAAERICGFLRNTDGFINGRANVFDESLGEYVSKSVIAMTIAGGEEEQCLE